jgi:hypothetical protein
MDMHVNREDNEGIHRDIRALQEDLPGLKRGITVLCTGTRKKELIREKKRTLFIFVRTGSYRIMVLLGTQLPGGATD